MRRRLFWQVRNAQSIAYLTPAGQLLALAMIYPLDRRRAELALSIAPAAVPHMLQLIREAHLTLARIADTSVLVVAHINPRNRAGQRMARLCGFRPSRLKSETLWVWRP